jgi:hypothetical protein
VLVAATAGLLTAAPAGSLAVMASGLASAAPAMAAHSPAPHRRHGTVTLTDKASRIVSVDSTFVVKGRVSKWLVGQRISLDYRDPATKRWVDARKAVQVTRHGKRFSISMTSSGAALPVSKQGLHVRVRVHGDRYVEPATASWRLDSYTFESLATLPVTSGSLVRRDIRINQSSGPITADAFAPAGTGYINSVTLTIPAGCGRVQGGFMHDDTYSHYYAFGFGVQHNGAYVINGSTSQIGGFITDFSFTVAPGDTITFSTTYDAAYPDDRPWISQAWDSVVHKPYVLCAKP